VKNDMTDFVVTARKWRPLRFEDVVGQGHVTSTLRNAIAQNRLAHAYLFSGSRGVGKTTTARLLAKAVNCLKPENANPDNTCELCTEINSGQSFNVLEIDGASNRGIDEIRSLRESVRFPPAKGTKKVYIIDEVHMLTKEAFNALLKTLEEPPRHVLFIFATTEIHKLPATILSRCQRFDFRRLSGEEIAGNLRIIAEKDGITLDDGSLRLIARKADGSLRDAQSLFDQAISLCGTNITHEDIRRELRIVDQETFFRVTDMVTQRDPKAALQIVDEIVKQGYDTREFLEGIIEHLRNLMVVKTTGSTELVEAADGVRQRYRQEADAFTVPDLLRLQRFIGATHAALRWTPQPRFRLEADLIQMAGLSGAQEVGDLLERIDGLKKKAPEEPRPVTQQRLTANPEPREAAEQQHTVPSSLAGSQRMPPPAAVGEETVRERWPGFVSELKEKRIALGMALDGTSVLAVHGHLIKVGCRDEFTTSSVKRYKQELQDSLQRVLNTRVQIEPVLDQSLKGSGSSEGKETAAEPKVPMEEHPVVKAMIRELGAEPI
jgi:DNA polymerase-3 subunit gamma/tau